MNEKPEGKAKSNALPLNGTRSRQGVKRIALVDMRTGACKPGNGLTSSSQAAMVWESFQAAAADASKLTGISRVEFVKHLIHFVGPTIQLVEDAKLTPGRITVPIWSKALRIAIGAWKTSGKHDTNSMNSVQLISDTASRDTSWLTKDFESSDPASMPGYDQSKSPIPSSDSMLDGLTSPHGGHLQERIDAMMKAAADQVRAAIRADKRSNQDIAAAAGINKVTISKFLNDQKGLLPETLDRLAGVLGITLHVK